jgi:hypothetical protein
VVNKYGPAVGRSLPARCASIFAAVLLSGVTLTGCLLSEQAQQDMVSKTQGKLDLIEAEIVARVLTSNSLLTGVPATGEVSGLPPVKGLPKRYAEKGLPAPVGGVITLESGCRVKLAPEVGGVNEVTHCGK